MKSTNHYKQQQFSDGQQPEGHRRIHRSVSQHAPGYRKGCVQVSAVKKGFLNHVINQSCHFPQLRALLFVLLLLLGSRVYSRTLSPANLQPEPPSADSEPENETEF